MKCSKCKEDFEEKDIQLSHDFPKYAGGTDSDGRHYLCKKCPDIYERFVFSAIVDYLLSMFGKEIRKIVFDGMKRRCKNFAKGYFKEVDDGISI